jgi:hypothetical protein
MARLDNYDASNPAGMASDMARDSVRQAINHTKAVLEKYPEDDNYRLALELLDSALVELEEGDARNR